MTKPSSKLHPAEIRTDGHQASHEKAATESEAAPLAAMPWLWPLYFADSINNSTASILKWYTGILAGAGDPGSAPDEARWQTANRVMLDLPTMSLRDFSTADNGQPTLICAPFALHRATICDFASGHSIVQALLQGGLRRVYVTDWLSATSEMKFFSIDTYLADLNVAVDALRGPVDLIGLCQGGWMALVFAARFPEKVRRLVLVGAPIDVRAASSDLMRRVDELPLTAFENLVNLGEGRVLGRYALKLWGSASTATEPEWVLQLSPSADDARFEELKQRLARWNAATVDLPGTYYLQVVQRIFKQNQLAEGHFVALGRTIDLRTIEMPIYLLAAENDEVISPEQLLAVTQLTSTPKGSIGQDIVPGGHVGLFMGAETIVGAWPRIARWLSRDMDIALAS